MTGCELKGRAWASQNASPRDNRVRDLLRATEKCGEVPRSLMLCRDEVLRGQDALLASYIGYRPSLVAFEPADDFFFHCACTLARVRRKAGYGRAVVHDLPHRCWCIACTAPNRVIFLALPKDRHSIRHRLLPVEDVTLTGSLS